MKGWMDEKFNALSELSLAFLKSLRMIIFILYVYCQKV